MKVFRKINDFITNVRYLFIEPFIEGFSEECEYIQDKRGYTNAEMNKALLKGIIIWTGIIIGICKLLKFLIKLLIKH